MTADTAAMSATSPRAAGWAHLALWLVVLLPIGWGAHQPYGWDVDNIAPGSVLRGLSQSFGPAWYSSYGPLPYYLVAIVYLPFLAVFRAAGELGPPSSVYPWGFAHPDFSVSLLGIVARLVSFALALWIVRLASRDERASAGRLAWIVPLLASGSPVFVFYAHTTNVDLYYVAWLFVAFHLAETAVTPRGLAAAAAAAIGALCSKEQAAPFAACALGLAALRARSLPAGALRGVAVVLGAALGTYVLLWKLPFHTEGWRAHHDFVLHVARYPRTYPLSLDGVAQMARRSLELAPVALGWPVLAGLALAPLVRPSLAGLGARSLGCALYLVGFLGPVGYIYPRFLLPLLLVALPLAARSFDRAFDRAARLAPARAALVAVLLVAWASGGPNLARMQLGDSRERAGAWLRRLPAHTHVEIAGNPRFQARVPRDAVVTFTRPDSLRANPRGPLGEVVLVSSFDGRYFSMDSTSRVEWWEPVRDTTRYRRVELGLGAFRGNVRDLLVSPIVTVYARRGSRADRELGSLAR